MLDLGTVKPGQTIYVPFNTFDSNDPSASVTITGLATTDIEIYKDGSTTQRASDAGYSLLDTDGIDFDSTTGIHGISIDLANNTTAGFYASGSQYWVVIASITVDAATINFVAATFRIGYPEAMLNTTIATLASQTSFTLTDGPAEDDALNGTWCVIHDVASQVQIGKAVISDYTGSTKTVTLAVGTTFTVAATDNIAIMGLAPLQPTTTGNTLDVTSTGAAGIDWGNVENPATAVDLSGTDIQLCDTTTTVTNQVTANVTAVSGDTTAANNLEADYDGTGYNKSNSTIGTCTVNTDMRGTDNAALASALATAQTDLDTITGSDGVTLATTQANYAPAKAGDNMGTVSSVTGNVDGNVTGSVGSNLELGPAEVNAEVLDVLNTDTFAEPAQGAPGATVSLAAKIGYLYKAWRNRSTQTASQYSLYNDDATTVDHKATVSDNGTTADKGEVGTGP